MIRAAILQTTTAMQRILLSGLLVLAMGAAGCEPTERGMTPIPAPEGTGAPLFDEGVEPRESQEPIDEDAP